MQKATKKFSFRGVDVLKGQVVDGSLFEPDDLAELAGYGLIKTPPKKRAKKSPVKGKGK